MIDHIGGIPQSIDFSRLLEWSNTTVKKGRRL
jgi:hypothetical protein